MSARSTRTNLSLLRTAGLFGAATLGAVGLSGVLSGTAGAFTPAPTPTLPIAQAEADPEPPAGPVIVVVPTDDGPELDGPDDLAQPVPTPDPHPPAHPQGPGDLTDGEDDPGFGGPDDFTNGEDDPGFGGPDDFTNGEDDPGFGGPDDFANPEGGPGDPDPTPEPQPEVESDTEVLDETASPDAAAEELAFTGGDLDLVTGGLALLGVGGLATTVAAVRRRRDAQA